jgi:hypothetical protein
LQQQVPGHGAIGRAPGPQSIGEPQHEARDDPQRFAREIERERDCAAQGDEMAGAADGVGRERDDRHRQQGN